MVFRFGPYELNGTGFELRRSGRRVHLASRPMELLLLLVGRPGELVSREEIARSLWPGLQVEDLVARINTAVSQIRAALQEDATRARYIETVIGKGYRFVGSVIASPATASIATAPTHVGPAPEATNLAPVAALKAERASRENSVALPEPPAQVTLPSNPLAAAVHNAKPLLAFGGTVIFLAAMILGWVNRARFFEKSSEPSPTLAYRQITTNDVEHPISAAAISPDATLLAYADPTGILIVELATGRTRLLAGLGLRVTRIAWFADQGNLVLTGTKTKEDESEIWVMRIADGATRLFRRNADSGVPAPVGNTIAFTINNGTEIRLAAPDGTEDRSVTRGRDGQLFSALFWSPDGARLNFEQRSAPDHPGADLEFNYGWSYHSVMIASGQETAVVNDVSFDSAGETADGTLSYLRTQPSSDQAHKGLWRVKVDLRTGAFVGKPIRVLPFGFYDLWTGMSLARNGEVAALKQDWQQNIFYGNLHDANTRLSDVQALTSNVATDCPHSWDLEGKMLYFESNRVGSQYHVFRKSIAGVNADMLTVDSGQQFFPTLMAEDKTLVYEQLQQNGERSIYRAREDGSQPRIVYKEDPLDEWRCPTTPSAWCVLRKIEGQRLFVFYLLDLSSGKRQQLAYAAWQPTVLGDWALSTDGRTVAIPNHEYGNPTIRLVSLDGQQRETVIRVHQTAQLWGLHWAPNGQGFFAEARNGAKSRIEFISTAGGVSVLRETVGNTWAIPSRDGRKLAFVNSVESANVFLWH